MKAGFLLLFVTLFSFNIYAADPQYYRDLQAPNKRFAISYSEGGKQFVDIYRVDKSGWQQHLSQETFSTQTELLQKMKDRGFSVTSESRLEQLATPQRPKNEYQIQNENMIWPTENQWSWEWELQYATWIRENVDDSFFIRSRIATDCADVAISLRWIFSRLHHLPMANSLAGTNRIFSNEVIHRDFFHLPTHAEWYQDQRFLAALEYVLNNTYTHSLIRDSYPVSIDTKTFLPGVHHLNLHSADTGHTMFVTEMSAAVGGLELVYSDVPRAIRRLYSDSFFQYEQFRSPQQGGFLRIRWAIPDASGLKLKPAQEMPSYSLMQYEPEFMRGYEEFWNAVENHLELYVSERQRLYQGAKILNEKIKSRLEIVEKGYLICQQEDCSEQSRNYDNWSTHSRDHKMYLLFDMLRSRRSYDEAFWNQLINENSIQVEGHQIFYHQILENFDNSRISPDPRHSLLRRWGVDD